MSLFGSGVCVGVTVLFRYDAGSYAFAALTLVAAAYALSRPLPPRERIAELVRILLPCWLGLGAVCVPVAIAFAVGGVLPDFYFDVLYFPTHYYRSMRSLPFPRLGDLVRAPLLIAVYLPVAVWAAALIVGIFGDRSRFWSERTGSQRWMILLLGLLSALFYLHGMVRVEIIHTALAIVPALMLAAALLSYPTLRRDSRWTPTGVAVVSLGILFVAVPTLIAIVSDSRAIAHNLISLRANPRMAVEGAQAVPASCRLLAGLERMTCFEAGSESDIDLIRYIEKHTSPDDPIFVGLDRHDRMNGNDVLLYFASARRPATKWYQFDPGLQTTEDIQRKMIRDLQTKNPALVVLLPAIDVAEPNEAALSSGVTLLDDFIRSKL